MGISSQACLSIPYFYTCFGFKNKATVELSCEQEVSPKDLAKAAKFIKDQKIKVLIGDAAEPKEPEGLAKETGTKVIILWATTDNSGNYLKTLRRNVETLVKALQ
jgi:ABC-type Zn uptake system ZnuABC Zn-binding protein ZnuA